MVALVFISLMIMELFKRFVLAPQTSVDQGVKNVQQWNASMVANVEVLRGLHTHIIAFVPTGLRAFTARLINAKVIVKIMVFVLSNQ